jgi:NDP-sugar pyrophosphorylase family protein
MSDTLNLPAVLMCGGLGTRLRPYTYVIPKPMFPIGERPILELLLARLRKAGITEIYISLGYKATLIESYFGDGSQYGVRLHYVREDQPLGTAGALNLLRERLAGRPFLMMNGDLVTRLDFRAMYAYHVSRNAAITVGVKPYTVSIPYGVVDDSDGYVTQLREKPTNTVNINAGIYLISPAGLALVPDSGRYDATQLIQAAMDGGLTVCSYLITEYWMDIGRFEDYHQANADAAEWQDDD